MSSKAILFLACFSLCGFIHVAAQQSRVDSLKPILAQHSDTSRIQFLLLTSEAYLSFAPRNALEPAAEARSIAGQVGDAKKEAKALHAMGTAYVRVGNMDEAIPCFNQSIELMRSAGSTDAEVGHLLISEGNAYNDAGAYGEALTVSLEAYTLFEKSNDKRGMTRALIVSGNVYRHMRNSDKAVADYEKALLMSQEIQDENLEAACMINLGLIHAAKLEYDAALVCYLKVKEIRERSGDTYNLGKVLNNIGGVYLNKAQDSAYIDFWHLYADTALHYYLAALELRKQIGDRRGQISSLHNIAGVMLIQNNNDKAIEYYLRALDIATDLKSLDLQMPIYEMLHESYARKNDIDKALYYYKQYTAVKDSIFTSEMSESIAEMQARFGVEKAEGETRAQEKQKKIVVLSSIIGGFLLLIIIVFIWRQSILRKKVNVALNQQKIEIEKKNDALNVANEVIESKNKDITDSIRYARRIQEAILPEMEFATSIGQSGFVFYKPKDIVSGDFYWMEKKGDLLLFAAVDCTGHGVPGAFVSIVCSNLLSQAVNEHGLREPNEILNDVNARLSVTLRQRVDESKVRDGMDIALCCLNRKSGELHFAGAFNPAWVIRNGEIIELKADKFPVGNFEDEELRLYVKQSIQLQKGDRIYIFSDGYSDQFGGPLGKKYKRNQFVNFLQKIQTSPIKEHGNLLEAEHYSWKGECEQIDDILVMGVEFPIA